VFPLPVLSQARIFIIGSVSIETLIIMSKATEAPGKMPKSQSEKQEREDKVDYTQDSAALCGLMSTRTVFLFIGITYLIGFQTYLMTFSQTSEKVREVEMYRLLSECKAEKADSTTTKTTAVEKNCCHGNR
jgi:hypothetical protein